MYQIIKVFTHPKEVHSAVFSHDDSLIGAVYNDKNIAIWDIKSSTKIADITGPSDGASRIAFVPN